jgi:5'-deoxynucleotidase YfbR-like HD superfamily hydrolase
MSGDVRRLSHVTRFSSIPVAVSENTAEHSFWVALYAVMIHLELGGRPEDVGAVVLAAVVHDLPECVTGDVVRTLKYSTPELKREVDRAEGFLSEKLLGPKVRGLLAVSELLGKRPGKKADPEHVKNVVKAADFMSLFQYMRREAMRGNLEIVPYFNRMKRDLKKMSGGYGELRSADEKAAPQGFPFDFYASLHDEAEAVSQICFHGPMPPEIFNRDV